MAKNGNITATRESLRNICSVPDKIISVYSLEKHVWADSHSNEAIKNRKPELQTISEFQIDPVRHFLNDIFRNIAAPYRPERRDNPIGQGYWIQAEFGSGKSHLLCFLASLALGSQEAWDLVREKEQKAGRGKRETLYQFWEDGLKVKNTGNKKGTFVIAKTLVGSGGGTVGYDKTGRRLTEYILDAAKEQLQKEVGKNLSLYPTELLADRFISEDLERYRKDLKKFLKDPQFFAEDEFEEIDEFIHEIQENKSPEYKMSCGNKLWRFYTEYLKVRPDIEAETEDILEHMVKTILAEGYTGVLLLIDEVSLFMKDRDESQRSDDEKTLVVLSNRLAKVKNLPVWTVCAAQQAIESKMAGSKNIIADDRLKLVPLLQGDKDYYSIVLSRVREIIKPSAISGYYNYYKRGFSWPSSIGEDEFIQFFPFHKPAIEVLRAITYELTTARSAIHFMHQTLKHQIKNDKNEIIRLWHFFDEALEYEEDPSGTHAGLAAIKTKREDDYRAYELCKRHIDEIPKGPLKVHREKSINTLQTLFLHYIAKTRLHGLTPEEIANSVLIEKSPDATKDENIQHYESIALNLKNELPQITESKDEENKPRFRFDPIIVGIRPQNEFQKARDIAESNERMQQEAWDHLLALDEWPVRTSKMTYDLSYEVNSIFNKIAPFVGPWKDSNFTKVEDLIMEVNWQNRMISGRVGMRDLGRVASENYSLPSIESDQTDLDFAVFVGNQPILKKDTDKILLQNKDPRIILWTPGEMTQEEHDRLLDFSAYRKLVSDWQGKETKDAVTIVNWVADRLQTEIGRIAKIVTDRYARGKMDALNNSNMEFHVAGELINILTPVVDRVLNGIYESRELKFDDQIPFSKEDGIKVINGIVKSGNIPKGIKLDKNHSAAQNFGGGLKIVKKSSWRELDVSGNLYITDIWDFIDGKLPDGNQKMRIDTIYKNFMGIGGLSGKNYGLTRRMVQIYLMCLVRQGKIRIIMGPKSPITSQFIDYSNIESIEFNTKIIDTILELQKMVKPENWEVLRLYAERLLDEKISPTNDDTIISEYRKKLIELFSLEKERSGRIVQKANDLFQTLGLKNPYENELQQIISLFKHDINGADDINLILFALKEALLYKAFDSDSCDQAEIDDLTIKMKNYRDFQKFIEYETDILTAFKYSCYDFPDIPELKEIHEIQLILKSKLNNIKQYIDSDLKLRTELIGNIPPQADESGTSGVIISQYLSLYAAMHDTLMEQFDSHRKEIKNILHTDEMKTLNILEEVSALQKNKSENISQQLEYLENQIFLCHNPSRASIERMLKTKPEDECGLSFGNYEEYLRKTDIIVNKAKAIFNDRFNNTMEFFFNPAIRQRLEQGKAEPIISTILKCNGVPDLKIVLVEACLNDPTVVETINRYLKQIVIKQIKISEFKPSIRTVEKNQITTLTKEFQKYLEDNLKAIDKDDDTLPMLQLE